MKEMRQKTLCLIVFFTACSVFARHPEYDRLSGFAEHQKTIRSYDKNRDSKELEHLEEQYQWELERLNAIEEHKKQKEIESPKEGGPEWKADKLEKQAYEQEIEAARRKHVSQRDEFNRSKYPELPTEEQELDIFVKDRPRYDLKKRPAFGAPSKWTAQSSGSGSSRTGGTFSGGSAFPPPPPFDDFSDDGFVPAPNLGGDFDSGDFPPPPPPPPPPPFSDGGDFPDIPPPIPSDFGEGIPDAF